MEQLGVFVPPSPAPLDGLLVNCRVTPSIKFASTRVERGTVRVKGLAQEHNMTFGTKTGLLDPETSALNMRPPHLPLLPTKELTI